MCPTVPSIIRIYETSTEIKIMSEYVEGDDLETLIEGKKQSDQISSSGLTAGKPIKFSELEIKIIAAQLLLTLDFFERCGIVHRDLKP
jgi:serine/threonine protein kinase